MIVRLRRTRQALLEVFDYRTFVVLTAFLALLIVSYLVFSATRRADQAFDALDRQTDLALDIRAAQSRRIDLLEAELIATTRQSTGNATAVQALIEQLRQLGQTPVTTGMPNPTAGPPTSGAQPSPRQPTASASPRPASSPTPASSEAPSPSPTPRPSPSPPRPCLIPDPRGGCLISGVRTGPARGAPQPRRTP